MPVIVDFHTHILPDDFRSGRDRILAADQTFRAMFSDPRRRTASAADLVAEMDHSGADCSVVLGYGWTDRGVARLANDYALDAAARHPGRIVPFCSVNPAWGPEAVVEVERCAAAGARGIGELHADTQGFDPADEALLRPLMAAADDLGLIVTIHASEPVGHPYPGKGTVTPSVLMSMVQAFPGVRFVLAHWGGGLAFYSLMPGVRESLRNVYFDSAASPFLYDRRVFAIAAGAAGPDRILFGSDYPLLSQRRVLRQARDGGLPPEDEAAVLGGNAARLLGPDAQASSIGRP